MTIIGKKYKARDNSWSINLTNPTRKLDNFGYIENNPRLAGTVNDRPIGSTVVTEPFKINVKSPVRDSTLLEREFIIVEIDAPAGFPIEHAMVMYFPEGVEGYESDYIEYEEVKPKMLS